MKCITRAAALVVAVLLATPLAATAADTPAGAGKADAPAKQSATTSVEKMTDGIIGMFPRAEGRVLTSGDKEVRVAIGSSEGVRPGMTVYISREGEPIIHPVTKVVLGHKASEVAVGVTREVSEKDSLVEITELHATQVAEGDTARLPTDKKGLLVCVSGKETNELVVNGVLDRLRDSNRFKISGPAEIDPAKLDGGKFISGLANDSGADYVLLVSTAPTVGQGLTEASLRLVSAGGETAYESDGTVNVTYAVFDQNVMGVPLVRGEMRDFFRIDDLPYRGTHMDSGDLDGDGRPEIVVSDGRDLHVYRFRDGVLRSLWTYRGVSSDQHLDVETADMNHNGRDEIYVTNFQRGRIASFVVEYDGDVYKKIYGPSPLMFRVLVMPDGKKRLLTTTIGANSPFSGTINEYAWKGADLELLGPAGLPDAVKDPYGFVIADVVPEKDKLTYDPSRPDPKPEPEIVMVDDSDYLEVLDIDDGERIWESRVRYGGYDNFFDPDVKGYILPNKGDPRGKVRGRLIVREDPGGRKIIVLTKNIALIHITTRFRGYSGAEIYGLAWDGTDMSEIWSIKPIEGYIADITIDDVLEKRRDDILIVSDPTYKLEQSSSTFGIGSVKAITDQFSDSSSLLLYKIPMR